MKLHLVNRPTIALLFISLLLLGLAGVTTWYVHRLQQSTSTMVRINVTSARAARELEISIRELRTQLDRYLIDADRKHLKSVVPELQKECANWLQEAERVATTPVEVELMRRVRNGYEQFIKEFDRITGTSQEKGVYSDIVDLIDTVLLKKILDPAHEYLRLNEGLLERITESNEQLADRLILVVALLGIIGALGGVFVGWGIAATMNQSRERLEQTASQLHRVMRNGVTSTPPRPGLDSTIDHVTQSVSAILERLDRTEREVLHAEQLAMVGQMAAGIAHELRNPLMTMKILIQKAVEARNGTSLQGRDLHILDEELGRLEHTIADFLNFARPPQLMKKSVVLPLFLEEIIETLRPRASLQGIDLVTEFPKEPIRVEIDAGQFRQVIVNLVLNALDAQPEGGKVKLHLEAKELPSKLRDWILRVEDDGPGIPPTLGDRIFEPFVSTKESGMGLGLSICRRIIEAHGGSIWAETRLFGGANLILRLPLDGPTGNTVVSDPKVSKNYAIQA